MTLGWAAALGAQVCRVPQSMGDDHRWKDTAPACAQRQRPTSENTARSAPAFSWRLGLAQSWRISIPGCKGPIKATTHPRPPGLLIRGRFTQAQHVVPGDFVPQPQESLAPGAC